MFVIFQMKMTKPNAPKAHTGVYLLGHYVFGLSIHGFNLYANDLTYLGRAYIMSTLPKAMLFPGFLPESLEKIQLIL